MRFQRTVLAIGVVAGSLIYGGHSRAQAPADLAAGRQLFVDALKDEENGRFAEALAKYQRVLLLRDTANIRYRMGSSLEHLGKIVQAVDAYSAAVRLGTEGATSGDAEVVRAAQARLDALAPKVAHVALKLPVPPPPEVEVTVDGEPVAAKALPDLPLDPGSHVVAATAKGTRPFRAQISLLEGSRVDVPILLEPVTVEPPPPPPPQTSSPYRTIGIVSAAAGGVLLIGGVIVLALRSSAIGTLNDACPNRNCPASRQDELQGTQDRAKLEGPLGVALLATGAAALGTGIVMVAIGGSDTKPAARLGSAPVANGAMLTLARGF
jgi:hypothetical protein